MPKDENGDWQPRSFEELIAAVKTRRVPLSDVVYQWWYRGEHGMEYRECRVVSPTAHERKEFPDFVIVEMSGAPPHEYNAVWPHRLRVNHETISEEHVEQLMVMSDAMQP